MRARVTESPASLRRNLFGIFLVLLVTLVLPAASFAQGAGEPPKVAQAEKAAEPPTDLEKRLLDTQAALRKVDNYTAIFHRIEMVNGKMIVEEISTMKFKRPFKVYMKNISPSKGQESLFVLGANDDKIRAHGTGLTKFITVNLDPNGGRAMQNSRHPMTDAGLEFLIKKISLNLQRAVRAGEFTSKEHGEKTVYGRKTLEIEGILPKDATKGYYCYRCIVNFDMETGMPIKTQIFDWNDQLIECYGFETLKLNAGLTDKDFDSKNPEYHF